MRETAAPGAAGDHQLTQALAALNQLSGKLHFYGNLAAEDLDQPVPLPPLPAPLTADGTGGGQCPSGPGPRPAIDRAGPAQRGRARVELQPARHERPRPARRRRTGLRTSGLGPLHQHQRPHPQRDRPGAALPDALPQRSGRQVGRARPRPGLRLWPDPAGIALRRRCTLQRRRLGPDAADAGHRALDGAQDRRRLQRRHDHRPRRQPEDRHRLPQARARRLRRLAG